MDIDRIRGVVARMKLSEKLAFACGGVAIPSVDRLNVPSLTLNNELLPFSASEPSTLALGCSFSRELCASVSRAKSTDAARSKNAFAGNIGCGLIRDPMRVDASEFFSEDAFVTAELLNSYAGAGVIGYCFKDALGQGEYVARTVDRRALNELYLYPLRKAGRHAAAVQLDGGYLNGNHVGSSRAICDMYAEYVCRDTMFITKYGDGRGSKGIAGGGAYQLGAETADKKAISRAIVNGEIVENKLNYSIERTLLTVAKTHEFYKKPFDRTATEPEIVFDTSVLLKNDGILPARKEDITLFGNAEFFDDGKDYTIFQVRDAVKRAGRMNAFILTDYESGISAETLTVIENTASKAKTVVVLCGACAVPLPFKNASAVIFCPYCPNIKYIIEMLTKVSPTGHLPFTWCESADEYPINNKKFADRGDFRYESVLNGYLLFNNFSSKVLYPFGHGLNYTEYEIGKLSLSSDGQKITADFTIKNVGEYDGVAVCQLYLSHLGENAFGQNKRLAAFERVNLKAGEEKNVSLNIDVNDFAVYDENSGSFAAPSGKFAVALGLSSTDIRASGEIKVSGSKTNTAYKKKAFPSYFAGDRPFEPTAPEIEKLLKTPFIQKPQVYPDLEKPKAAEIKKTLKKALKATPPRLRAVVKFKIENKPLRS